MITNRPDDSINYRCGHNFPPLKCPYTHCGYRLALQRLHALVSFCEGLIRSEEYRLPDAMPTEIDDARAGLTGTGWSKGI